MKRVIRYIALSVVLLGTTSLFAQEYTPTVEHSNDFRGRVEAAFEWSPINDLSLEASFQARLKDDFSTVDRLQTSVGLNYEVCKYFNLGADYVLINPHDKGSWKQPRHRLNLNFEGVIKAGRFDLSLRERLQTTFRTDSVNRFEKMNPELILRSRVEAVYNIRHSKWSPYLLFELNNTLNAPKVVDNYLEAELQTDNYITRYRLGVGTKYRITRSHRLEFYYYIDFDRGYNIDYKGNKGTLKGYVEERQIRHIFGISYKFKL